jgi:hypothetical protein
MLIIYFGIHPGTKNANKEGKCEEMLQTLGKRRLPFLPQLLVTVPSQE